MQGWVLMSHDNWADWSQAHGDLIGSFYSDIESVCRAITKDWLIGSRVVSTEYANGGDKVLIQTENGSLFGAYKIIMPMREDMPTHAPIVTHRHTTRRLAGEEAIDDDV